VTAPVVVLSGPTLPPRLADLPRPPKVLYLWGELPRGPAVAIVGTRYATTAGLEFAEALSHDLARAGVAVFSGGAEGIDSAAHRGALRAGGTTAVIAPAGFDCPYPSENRRLFEEIVERGGAYASVVPAGTDAKRHVFFRRNSCLVALAHALVVVEAGFRSGSLNAARWARVLGRPLLVVPHAPWAEKGRGCLIALRRGALLCEGPNDVLAELDRMLFRPVPSDPDAPQPDLPFPSVALGHAADADRVKAALAAGATHLDQVQSLTGLSMATIQSQILTLTLDGVLAPDPSGHLTLLKAPPK
jgi:DNA processing protein